MIVHQACVRSPVRGPFPLCGPKKSRRLYGIVTHAVSLFVLYAAHSKRGLLPIAQPVVTTTSTPCSIGADESRPRTSLQRKEHTCEPTRFSTGV